MTAATHTPSTATAARPTAARPRMDPARRISLTAGVLYLLTFVSIPTLGLYKP